MIETSRWIIHTATMGRVNDDVARERPRRVGEKKVSADHGLPRGTIRKNAPAIIPAPTAGPYCMLFVSGSNGADDSNPLIMKSVYVAEGGVQMGFLP